MPVATITYRIFIASPTDVEEERVIIRSVAEDLNILNTANIRLEVIGWETNTYPAIGEDAQDVINTQINDDYDIFIGIFWSRFGTKTKRDLSGTKEEFERAYRRYLKDNNSVNILMYFKNAPIAPLELDLEQIKNIQEFNKDLRSRGLLIGTFNKSDEFSKILKLHLSNLLNTLTTKVQDIIKETPIKNSIAKIEDEGESDLGYWEYMDKAVEGMNGITPVLGKITKEIIDLGDRLRKRTAKIQLVKTKSQDVINRESRKIVDESANDLDIFNKNTTPLIPTLNNLFNNSMDSFNEATLIHKKFFSEESLISSLNSLKFLKDGLIKGVEGSDFLNASIKGLPPLTSKLVKSKNECVRLLTKLTDELLSYVNIIENIILVIET